MPRTAAGDGPGRRASREDALPQARRPPRRESRARDGQAERGEEAPGDGLAVLQAMARRGLERVAHRVAEVQGGALPRALERIRGHDARLHARATRRTASVTAADSRAASGASSRAIARWKRRVEEGRLHDLREAGAERAEREASRASTCRRRRGAARGTRPRGSSPAGRSTAVLPPSALSHAARSVVGAWTTGTPRSASAAARPATSPTVPPPSATTPPSRRRPRRTSSSRRRPRTSQVLAALAVGDEEGILLKTPSTPPAEAAWPCRRKTFLEAMRNQRPGAMAAEARASPARRRRRRRRRCALRRRRARRESRRAFPRARSFPSSPSKKIFSLLFSISPRSSAASRARCGARRAARATRDSGSPS